MLRITPSKSAAQAKDYFTDALVKSDYYMDGQELQAGNFQGRLAERLGLRGPITKEAFFALCENLHPSTGKQITPNVKANRLTGWDMTFSVPKSVSIIHALVKDNHILDAFQVSVTDTMKDIEMDVRTRVRKGGLYDDRQTGELIWSEFVHQTSRPVDGHAPDPHLHCHSFVHNVTWDDTEKRFKAAKVREVVRSVPYYTARFYKRLTDKLVEMGYQIRRTPHSFEIVGVPQEVINHFSKRKDEVEQAAQELGITDAKALDGLGAKTRSKKQKGLSMAELKTEWKKQLLALSKEHNFDLYAPVRFTPNREKTIIHAKDAVDHAMTHSFEHVSVTSERKLLAEAYRYALGDNGLSLEDIEKEFSQDGRLLRIKQGEQSMCTTQSILKEEMHMIELARSRFGQFAPLYQKAPDMTLEGQQADAVKHILTTPHGVSIVKGAAGVGKTHLLKEAKTFFEKAGKKLITVAPTSQASRQVLVEDGFKDATTIADLLVNKELQEKLQGQILWVDEAGLLGVADTIKILELAKEKHARVIFGGDSRQHASVVRGDALRLLNTVGGIQAAEVTQIRRQKDNAQYLAAVQDLALGNVKDGFEKLDKMNAIKEIDQVKGKDELVNDYMTAIKKGKSALVISPTHLGGEVVTKAIREKLRGAGKIGEKETNFFRYMNLNYTEAQKADFRNFSPGQVVQFHQNAKGIKRGSNWTVSEVKNGNVHIVGKDGATHILPKNKAKDYSVYAVKPLALSKGDKIRITQNGFDEKEKRLNNGMMLDVVSVRKDGKLVLRNKDSKTSYVVPQDFGHMNHAYCLTSHSSQGKTVDSVFIYQTAATFSATDAKQFYVSCTRGKKEITIYTDDKKELLANVSELGDRQSALELMVADERHKAHVELNQRTQPVAPNKIKTQDKTLSQPHKTIELDYEPD